MSLMCLGTALPGRAPLDGGIAMKESLKAGLAKTKHYVVDRPHVIEFLGPQVPQVLASPWMLFFMEHAAREAVLPHLDIGEDTLGVAFEFEHLAASPIGCEITASAELIGVQGRRLHFKIEAHDGHELIGRGKHVRAVVEVAKFSERVKPKLKLTKS
jgi:predicted thioesterase